MPNDIIVATIAGCFLLASSFLTVWLSSRLSKAKSRTDETTERLWLIIDDLRTENATLRRKSLGDNKGRE